MAEPQWWKEGGTGIGAGRQARVALAEVGEDGAEGTHRLRHRKGLRDRAVALLLRLLFHINQELK